MAWGPIHETERGSVAVVIDFVAPSRHVEGVPKIASATDADSETSPLPGVRGHLTEEVPVNSRSR